MGPKHPAQLALSGSSIDRPSGAPIGELCCSFSQLAGAVKGRSILIPKYWTAEAMRGEGNSVIKQMLIQYRSQPQHNLG